MLDNQASTDKRSFVGGRYGHIDALRAAAVMLVVFQHAGLGFVPGPSGVTLFFVISGFVITNILVKERERTGSFHVRSFYVKRLLKLAPPFLVIIVVPTLLLGVVMRTLHLDWSAFMSQIFFAYNWLQVISDGEPENLLPGSQVVWSLAVEEQFYIAFSLIWMALVRSSAWLRGLGVIAVGAILTSSIMRVWLVGTGASEIRIARATDTRLDAIAWGILAAILVHLWRAGRLRWLVHLGNDWVLALAGCLFLVGFVPLGATYELTLRYTFHALAAVLIILYGLLPGGKAKRAFQSICGMRIVNVIGLASYSIYLVHYVLGHLLEPLTAGAPAPVAVAVFVVAGVGAGIGIYYLVEVPAHRLKVRLYTSS